MKYGLVLLLIFLSANPAEIAKTNQLKKQAEEAYTNGDFAQAAAHYSQLYDTLGVTEDRVGLNLAHSYFALGDSANAKQKYQSVTSSPSPELKSIAYQQLGVMAKNAKSLEQSLAYLKSALKANPANEGARYDYEVVKKLLKEQQEKQQDQQNKDDQNKDQNKEDQENKDKQDPQDKQDQENEEKSDEQEQQDQEKSDQEKEGEKGEEQEQDQEPKESEQTEEQKQQQKEQQTKQKLEDMNMTEEKAQMILEALRNNEIQYLQQQKRKPTKSPQSGKPDW